VAAVSAASAALLSCRVRCPYYCIYHLLMANKMMMMSVQTVTWVAISAGCEHW